MTTDRGLLCLSVVMIVGYVATGCSSGMAISVREVVVDATGRERQVGLSCQQLRAGAQFGTGSGDGHEGYAVKVTSPDGDRVSCQLSAGGNEVREELSAEALADGEQRKLTVPLSLGSHVEVTVQGVEGCASVRSALN